jgi:ABC-2 type transport system permease protein
VALNLTGTIEIPQIQPATIFNLVLWFVLGFLLFAVMFGAAGSLVSRTEDAQNVAFPMSLTAVVGFFLSITALNDPAGVAATVGTFIPLTAPFVVPVRAALDAIPAWQYILSVIITIATIIGMTFVAGRIYAGALLRYGGRTKLSEAWRADAS